MSVFRVVANEGEGFDEVLESMQMLNYDKKKLEQKYGLQTKFIDDKTLKNLKYINSHSIQIFLHKKLLK